MKKKVKVVKRGEEEVQVDYNDLPSKADKERRRYFDEFKASFAEKWGLSARKLTKYWTGTVTAERNKAAFETHLEEWLGEKWKGLKEKRTGGSVLNRMKSYLVERRSVPMSQTTRSWVTAALMNSKKIQKERRLQIVAGTLPGEKEKNKSIHWKETLNYLIKRDTNQFRVSLFRPPNAPAPMPKLGDLWNSKKMVTVFGNHFEVFFDFTVRCSNLSREKVEMYWTALTALEYNQKAFENLAHAFFFHFAKAKICDRSLATTLAKLRKAFEHFGVPIAEITQNFLRSDFKMVESALFMPPHLDVRESDSSEEVQQVSEDGSDQEDSEAAESSSAELSDLDNSDKIYSLAESVSESDQEAPRKRKMSSKQSRADESSISKSCRWNLRNRAENLRNSGDHILSDSEAENVCTSDSSVEEETQSMQKKKKNSKQSRKVEAISESLSSRGRKQTQPIIKPAKTSSSSEDLMSSDSSIEPTKKIIDRPAQRIQKMKPPKVQKRHSGRLVEDNLSDSEEEIVKQKKKRRRKK